MDIKPNIKRIIEDSIAIEQEEAKKAGSIGYMARTLIQATMPHSNPGNVTSWKRVNGKLSFIMRPFIMPDDNSIGLPYGSIPRLLLAWISREAVLKKEKHLILGPSLSQFLAELGLHSTGGKNGDITRLKEQMIKLFSSSVSWLYKTDTCFKMEQINIVDNMEIWWEPTNPNGIKWNSSINLSEKFYQEIVDKPTPIDMRAIKSLKNSALAIDIYCWLTYRMSYLRDKSVIPWESLQFQFGSNCQDNFHGRYKFKENFKKQLKKVLLIYPVNIDANSDGVVLLPSKTHIPKKKIIIIK